MRVDQAELETVLPGFGGTVEILNGKYNKIQGELINIDTKKFKAKVIN